MHVYLSMHAYSSNEYLTLFRSESRNAQCNLQIHGQLAARELRADAVAASAEKSAGSVISAPPGASPNRLEVQDTLAPVSPDKVQALSSTNHAPISAETANAPCSTDDAMGTQLIESKSLGLVIKMEKGKVVVQDCLSGGVAAQVCA